MDNIRAAKTYGISELEFASLADLRSLLEIAFNLHADPARSYAKRVLGLPITS
jgi:hypothetical protein